MSTVRLHYDDPLLLVFEARVIAHGAWKGARSIVLDRTAFYPESGGQMADRGTLFVPGTSGDIAIREVQADEAGVVHHVIEHVIEGALPPVGSTVQGTIDAVRRRTHMALHTAQHLLSRALVEVAGADTLSSRLGESVCTIDVDRDAVSEAKVAEAEALVSGIVDEDRPVRQWFPTDEELASLSLRRAPKAEHARVRVVDVAGFDVSPCGGTHVLHTSQVGVMRVLGTERYKGGTRVSFSAGPRARRELATESITLREIAKTLGCAPAEAPAQLARVRESLDLARLDLGKMRAALARSIAERAGTGPVWIEEGGVELIRAVCSELTREGDRLAVVAGPVEGGVHVVVARGPGSTVDARETFARVAAACGGRGGGRPERAEGRMPASADVRSALGLIAR